MPVDMAALRPVTHRQLVLFDALRDLHLGLWDKFPPPRDPALAAALHEFARDHGRRLGWSLNRTSMIQRGVRIMLGIQDTPGAPIRRSDVVLLTRIKHSAAVVADVLDAAGMLEEDREPAVVRWATTATAGLPEQIRGELGVWVEVMRNGHPTPPRRKPRAEATVRSQLSFALPALRAWATTHDSLREISRADVLAVLPTSGQPRNTTLQALKSIFKVLKIDKLVFTNPTTRVHGTALAKPIPPPLDLEVVRAALDSDKPARAALAALLAYHGVRIPHLRDLRLTDLRDGRLHIGEQMILLAEPVQRRLGGYLDYRNQSWPTSPNPHLFIHVRSWTNTRPVTSAWIRDQLGMSGQLIREDRILDEVHATGGDIRALADLFGISVASAYRYATTLDHTSPAGAR